MKHCISIIAILLFVLVFGLPAVWAQDGLGGILSRPGEWPESLLGVGEQLVAADFDNDDKPDAALLFKVGPLNGQTCFRIELHVTAGRNHTITFSSGESGLSISALDVNRDGAPDIVIEREFTHERLQTFLNDGHGDFHEVKSKDHQLPNPSAPLCLGWSAEIFPVSCFPATRGFELPGLRHASTVAPNRDTLLSGCAAALRSQSSVPSHSAPRAPPSSFVL